MWEIGVESSYWLGEGGQRTGPEIFSVILSHFERGKEERKSESNSISESREGKGGRGPLKKFFFVLPGPLRPVEKNHRQQRP